MKKSGYLLLLTPALFLASCQTTPKIDTIDEKEAKQFIIDHYKIATTDFVAPSKETKIRWKITSGGDEARKEIGSYILTTGDYLPEGTECKIENDERLEKYKAELTTDTPTDFDSVGSDAIIGMNEDIYTKLIHSSNDVGPYYLEYKYSGGGLAIISKSTTYAYPYTRAHYYDKDGRETKFEVNKNKDNKNYTMTIEFKYSI